MAACCEKRYIDVQSPMMDPEEGLTRSHPDVLQSLEQVISSPSMESLAREVLNRLTAGNRDNWRAPASEIDYFCTVLCAERSFRANKFLLQLLRAHLPFHRIYQSYFGEAARQLGAKWETNELSFVEVTLATSRIYNMLYALRRRYPPPSHGRKPKFLFSAVPGEQHTLGVEIATDLFRRNGWEVIHLIDKGYDDIIQMISDDDVYLLGLSVSGTRHLDTLCRIILAARVVRPDIKIMVGGTLNHSHAETIREIGVDSVITELTDAFSFVESVFGVESRL